MITKKIILLIILSISLLFLLFYDLDSPLLWQDEAEVALIARNITRFGLPLTWDGDFFISQEFGADSRIIDGKYIWNWSTWLQYYLTALSFFVFVESTFFARFPFSILGLIVALLIYKISLLIDDKNNFQRAILTLFLLTTNILFLLYTRQARYYSLSMLTSLLAIYSYLNFRKTGKLPFLLLYGLSLFLGFHSNFVLIFATSLFLILIPYFEFIHSLFLRMKFKIKTLLLVIVNSLFIIQSVFWIMIVKPAARGEEIGISRYWGGFHTIFSKLIGYINLINSFYFPIFFWLVIVFLIRLKRKELFLFNKNIFFIILIIFSHILVISVTLQFGQRYLVSLIPLFIVLTGFLCFELSKFSKLFSIVIIIFLQFTNIPFIFSERICHPSFLKTPLSIRSYLVDYIYSLGKNYPGPIEGIVNFFREKRITKAVVYTDYEAMSLKFYLPQFTFIGFTPRTIGIQTSTNDVKMTNFFIPRYSWYSLNLLGECEKERIKTKLIRHELSYYDLPWNNLPDITYHKFNIEKDNPKIIIYENNDPSVFDGC